MRNTKQGSKTKHPNQSEHTPGGSPNTDSTREDRSRAADLGVGAGQDDVAETDHAGTGEATGAEGQRDRAERKRRPHASH